MRKLIASLALALTVMFAPAAVTRSLAGVLADSFNDFTNSQGARNWYYGYFPEGNIHAFTQLPTFNSQLQHWQHATYGPPWTLVAAYHVHPGTSSGMEWVSRQWVSNYAGPVTVGGHIAKTDSNPASDGTYGRIYWNHQLVYEHFLAGTDGVGVDYSVPLTLALGDTLDFVVAPNGNDAFDGTVFSATISSVYDAVSVDFGLPVSVTSALGILNGLDDANIPSGQNPPIGLISPLQPRFWRIGPWNYQRVRALAPTIPIELIVQTGSPENNYNQLGPPWLNWAAYENALTALIAPFSPLPANVVFEPWNEPDTGWAFPPGSEGYQGFWNGTAHQFYETYLHAFQTIRGVLGPAAQVAGPAYALYSHQGVQDFLEYCLANGCEVNSLTWHELDDSSSVANLAAHVEDARTSFVQNPRYAPLKIQRIEVNEIIGGMFTHQPAGSLAYYGALEASKADIGSRSCWPLGGVSECFNGTLSGLLTANTYQPRGVWWLHKSYADGVSGRVRAIASSPQLVVLASSVNGGGNSGQILLGNSSFKDTVSGTPNPSRIKLSLKNLQALGAIGLASNVRVQLELIPNTDVGPLNGLQLLSKATASVVGGAAGVILPPLKVGDVFRVTFAPAVSARFHTLTPCRVLDTRNAAALLGGPALAPGATRSLPMTLSSCGIPSSAESVSINVAVTQPAAGGFLTLYPSNEAAPLASSINFSAGQTRANNEILRLASDGSINVVNGSVGPVHLILDVNGYFE